MKIEKVTGNIFDSIREQTEKVSGDHIRHAFRTKINADIQASVLKTLNERSKCDVDFLIDTLLDQTSRTAVEKVSESIPELSGDRKEAKEIREYIVRCVCISGQPIKEHAFRQLDGALTSLRQLVADTVLQVTCEAMVMSTFQGKLLK